MSKLIAAAKKFVVAEEGASLVEYGLLVALIACACIAAIGTLGNSINGIFTTISGAVNNANTVAS